MFKYSTALPSSYLEQGRVKGCLVYTRAYSPEMKTDAQTLATRIVSKKLIVWW